MSGCNHGHIADPPPGKHLRICLDCAHRLIECSACSAKAVARPDIAESGWTRRGQRVGTTVLEWTYCPDCSAQEPTP